MKFKIRRKRGSKFPRNLKLPPFKQTCAARSEEPSRLLHVSSSTPLPSPWCCSRQGRRDGRCGVGKVRKSKPGVKGVRIRACDYLAPTLTGNWGLSKLPRCCSHLTHWYRCQVVYKQLQCFHYVILYAKTWFTQLCMNMTWREWWTERVRDG